MKNPARGPLRRVVRTATVTRWLESVGTVIDDVEILECGHVRRPAPNARFGGTDIGDRPTRRCADCLDTTRNNQAATAAEGEGK